MELLSKCACVNIRSDSQCNIIPSEAVFMIRSLTTSSRDCKRQSVNLSTFQPFADSLACPAAQDCNLPEPQCEQRRDYCTRGQQQERRAVRLKAILHRAYD